MDNSDSATPLTLDDHIAFGRDYLELLKEGGGIMLSPPALRQFLKAAAEALERQRDQAPKRRKKGGRPPGGMGDQMARLIANDVPELDALRITKRAWGKSTDAVLAAYERFRKKTPPARRTRQKNPT